MVNGLGTEITNSSRTFINDVLCVKCTCKETLHKFVFNIHDRNKIIVLKHSFCPVDGTFFLITFFVCLFYCDFLTFFIIELDGYYIVRTDE